MSAELPARQSRSVPTYKGRYHIGWLWHPPTSSGKGRGWVFRVELEGRTYPEGSEFVPVYADEPIR